MSAPFSPYDYRDIFIQDQARRANLDAGLNYNLPRLREAFAEAGRGNNGVTAEILDELVTPPVVLHRSRPDPETASELFTPTVTDFTSDTNPIADAVERRLREGALSEAQTAKLEKDITKLAEKTGLAQNLIEEAIKNYEVSLQRKDKSGTLDLPQERTFFAAAINELHTATLAGGSQVITSTVPEKHIVVSELDSDRRQAFLDMGFDQNDLPARLPPGTIDQHEFLTSIHEAGHAQMTQITRQENGKLKVEDGLGMPAIKGQDIRTQAAEVAGDLAARSFNDPELAEIQEYRLQARSVNGFRLAMTQTTDHDTATAIRVYEQTGQQIDLEKFNEEKQGLMEKVRTALDGRKPTTSNLMVATQQVLDEASGGDAGRKLSAVQRAEATSFLRDAAAIGYVANPDYTNAPRLQSNVLSAAQPEAAAPGAR